MNKNIDLNQPAFGSTDDFSFRQAVEYLHEGVVFFDSALKIVYINRRMAEFRGDGLQFVPGGKISDLFTEKEAKRVESTVGLALSGIKSTLIFTIENISNHQIFQVKGIFSPFLNSENRIAGVIASVLDITETRHLREEDTLKDQHLIDNQRILLELTKTTDTDINDAYQKITEQVAKVVNTERTSIWLYNEQRTSIHCIDLYIRSKKEHTRGMMLFVDEFPAYFTALEQSRCIAVVDANLDQRTCEFSDVYLKKLNILSMLDTPIRFDGKLSGLICSESVGELKEWSIEDQEFSSSAADILSTFIRTHQLREAEKALEQSEKKYRQIVDNALIGIYKSNLSGQLLFINQAMIEILEIGDPSGADTINLDKFYQNTPDRKEFISLLVKERTLRNYELKLVTERGNNRVVLVNAYYEGGIILGMLMDITDRKMAEEEIIRSHERASESDRLKTSLMANMSHEFRTPMNAILGFSDLVASESNDPEMVFYARKIHAAGKRLMKTLKAILDLADLEATRSKIKIKEINIHETIREALLPFQNVASEKNLFLITEYKECLSGRCDDNLLQIILHNLIDNAIKFTNHGGVTIESDHTTTEEKTWVTIKVKDTGIGIPKEHSELIFHEFRQISEGYNRSYEGTGLGLTIARKMTEMLNGRITVESEMGLGSIFTLWIPAGSELEKRSEKELLQMPESSDNTSIRIKAPSELPLVLVVEDNDDNADIVKLYLKGKYVTERAENAFSAIKMANFRQYAAILMDINLGPGMDGLKATQEIRKQENYRKTPIVALTGYTMTGDCDKLLSGGCSHYLGKPFSQQELLGILNQIFTDTK